MQITGRWLIIPLFGEQPFDELRLCHRFRSTLINLLKIENVTGDTFVYQSVGGERMDRNLSPRQDALQFHIFRKMVGNCNAKIQFCEIKYLLTDAGTGGCGLLVSRHHRRPAVIPGGNIVLWSSVPDRLNTVHWPSARWVWVGGTPPRHGNAINCMPPFRRRSAVCLPSHRKTDEKFLE